MYGSWSCSGLENLYFWFDKEITLFRQFILIYKKTIELRSLEAFLFQVNRDKSGNSIDMNFG